MRSHTLLGWWMLLVVSAAVPVSAQSYRSTVNDGNDLYHEKKYDKADALYRKAGEKKAERIESYFNRGNAGYRMDDLKGALENYKRAGERATSPEEGAQLWYNAGDTFMKAAESAGGAGASVIPGGAGGDVRMEAYRQAVDAFKRSLKLNPADEDARYNLAYAMKKLEELRKNNSPDKNRNQKQNKNDKKDQKQNQKKNDDKQNQDKQNQDKQNKDRDKQNQDKDQQQNQDQNREKQDRQKQPQKQMPKQQAEQILNALERDEKDLQKKLKERRATHVNVDKDW